MDNADPTEQFRTRWRRWLGQKTRWDSPTWVTLLSADWLAWVDRTYGECGLVYRPIRLEEATRERVKEVWLTAIDHADMRALCRLDGIYVAEKLGL